MRINLPVSGCEVMLDDDMTIVTKTDLQGKITEVNEDFCRISGFSEQELLGQPHNLVRHPDMPEEAFADLWRTLKAGQPWKGLVKNRCKNGDHYWVYAHVAPIAVDGRILGYSSLRTKPSQQQVNQVEALYRDMKSGMARLRINGGKLVPLSAFSRINPARLVRAQPLYRQFLLLIGAIVIGCAAVAVTANVLIGRTQVNGPIYRELLQGQSLIADILPPPVYLVESHLLSHELVTASASQRPTLLEKGKAMGDEFEARYRHWQNTLSAEQISALGIDEAYQLGKTYLGTRESKFMPAIRENRQDDVIALLPELDALYAKHRLAIDHAIKSATAWNGETERSADLTITLGHRVIVAISLTLLSALTLLGWIILRNLLRIGDPDYAHEVISHVAAGNLAIRISGSCSERTLAGALCRLQTKLHRLVGRIRERSTTMVADAAQLEDIGDQLVSAIQRQNEATTNIAATVEELSISILRVAGNAEDAHSMSARSAKTCDEGAETIGRTAAVMQQIAEVVRESSDAVTRLGTQSDQIAAVVQSIREIADQTNLLALNAAIEAARAGEQGRGFAVVADEVRKLAERTAHSTVEIVSIIETIRSSLQAAIVRMEDGVREVDLGTAEAGKAREAISRIQGEADTVAHLVASISLSLQEQQAASNSIAGHVKNIVGDADENYQAVRRASESIHRLGGISGELQRAVSRFVV